MQTFLNKHMRIHERQVLLVMIDILAVIISAGLATFIACNFIYLPEYFKEIYSQVLWLSIIVVSINLILGSYRSLWRYASIEEMVRIMLGTVLLALLTKGFFIALGVYSPPTFVLTFSALMGACMVLSRFSYRIFRRMKQHRPSLDKGATRVLIVGAGAAGNLLLKEMFDNPRLHKQPVVFVDDDPARRNLMIGGVRVAGGLGEIEEICATYQVDEIVIAIPSAKKKTMAEIVNHCKQTNLPVKMVPVYDQILSGQVSIGKLRDVDITDLLGRDEIQTDMSAICDYLTSKTVVVTGGGGSIGSELCRQIVNYSPKRLIIIDNYENNAYDLQNELHRMGFETPVQVIIANVREYERLKQIFTTYEPEVVFHAAAHKHVPLMEVSPMEAVKNNVFGTYNVARVSHEQGVKRFVLISTDKAVNPTNVMGATKRIAERTILAFNSISSTDYVAVRFGNVLGSNGSVIPLFKKQIEAGGPVTVTHPDIIRYFMTIPEAVRLVLQAGSMAKGGEIFILDMGDPVKIVTLAEDLIRLSGYVPYETMQIVFSGLRPGEKLFEELLTASEGNTHTAHDKILIAKPECEHFEHLSKDLEILKRTAEAGECGLVRMMIKRMVPEYVWIAPCLEGELAVEEEAVVEVDGDSEVVG